jgi:hypothetical protein|tara:strand:- start:1148 stop:1570 length:423 start_codon:yes stop_codon:yes gene_type:complete
MKQYKGLKSPRAPELLRYFEQNPGCGVGEASVAVKTHYGLAQSVWDAMQNDPDETWREILHKKGDMVNSPSHYASGEIECIDAMVSAFGLKRVQEYAEIASFKYIWRAGKKDDANQDKAKSIWYQRFSMGDDPRGDLDPK